MSSSMFELLAQAEAARKTPPDGTCAGAPKERGAEGSMNETRRCDAVETTGPGRNQASACKVEAHA